MAKKREAPRGTFVPQRPLEVSGRITPGGGSFDTARLERYLQPGLTFDSDAGFQGLTSQGRALSQLDGSDIPDAEEGRSDFR